MKTATRAVAILWMHLVLAVAFSAAFSSPGGAEEPDAAENVQEVLANQQMAKALKSRFSFDTWVLGCLSQDKFAELERMADKLRQDDVDLDWDDAGLRHFYEQATNTTLGEDLFGKPPTKRLEKWKKAFPKSKTPLLASSQYYIQEAWKVRGSGFADTVTEEGWKQFRKNMETSRGLLAEAEKLPGVDPDLYAQQISVAQALAWPRDETDRIAQKLLKNAPRYHPAHLAMAEYLLPRWHGEPGDMEAYAAKVADSIGGDAGAEIYTRIATRILRFYPPFEFFRVTRFEYPLMLRGLTALMDKKPTDRRLNEACFFAIVAQDLPAARKYFNLLSERGDPRDPQLWGRDDRIYLNWKKWLSEEPPKEDAARFSIFAHSWDVDRPMFLPDGSVLLSHGRSHVDDLRAWDVKTGEFLGSVAQFPMNSVRRIELSPDGNKLAAVIMQSGKFDEISIRDFDKRKQIRLEGNKGRVSRIVPDSEQLAVVTYENSILVWDLTETRPPASIEQPENVDSLAFAPDGKTIIARRPKELVALDVSTGKRVEAWLPEVKRLPNHLGYLGDGNTLVLKSHGEIQTWDYQHRKKLATVEIPMGVTAELSPDGRLLALRSSREVVLVEVSSGKELDKLEGHVAPIFYATFSPDSQTLATASRAGIIKLWDVAKYVK